MQIAFRNKLIQGSLNSVAIKLANVGLGFLAATALARTMGPTFFGTYTYALTMVSVLSIPTQFGLTNLLVRETAARQGAAERTEVWALWGWCFSRAFRYQAVIGGALVLAAAAFGPSGYWYLIFWATILAMTVTLMRLAGGALRGLGHVVQGQFPDQVARPVLLVVGLLVWLGIDPLNPNRAMAVHALAAGVALTLAGTWLCRQAPDPRPTVSMPSVSQRRQWIRAVGPLAFVGGMQQVNQYADLVILGVFRPASELGFYRIAALSAGLIALGLQAVTIAVSPTFARLHASSNRAQLSRVVRFSAIAGLLLAIPPFMIFVVAGEVLLSEVFGAEFRASYVPLLILASGQLVNAAAGAVGFLLNMAGHERETAKGLGVGAMFNVIVNVCLIPPFGMEGAATATALTFLLWNILLWRSASRGLGIGLLKNKQS